MPPRSGISSYAVDGPISPTPPLSPSPCFLSRYICVTPLHVTQKHLTAESDFVTVASIRNPCSHVR